MDAGAVKTSSAKADDRDTVRTVKVVQHGSTSTGHKNKSDPAPPSSSSSSSEEPEDYPTESEDEDGEDDEETDDRGEEDYSDDMKEDAELGEFMQKLFMSGTGRSVADILDSLDTNIGRLVDLLQVRYAPKKA
jgi:hypothetical protein